MLTTFHIFIHFEYLILSRARSHRHTHTHTPRFTQAHVSTVSAHINRMQIKCASFKHKFIVAKWHVIRVCIFYVQNICFNIWQSGSATKTAHNSFDGNFVKQIDQNVFSFSLCLPVFLSFFIFVVVAAAAAAAAVVAVIIIVGYGVLVFQLYMRWIFRCCHSFFLIFPLFFAFSAGCSPFCAFRTSRELTWKSFCIWKCV